MTRTSTQTRKTKETDIQMTLNIDGQGKADISTGIAFFDHMLESLTRHALFNLDIKATGDLDVGAHHTVEDIGIVFGAALKEALKDKKSIKRFGKAIVAMDDALVLVAIDLSGRSYLGFDVQIPALTDYIPEEFVKFNPQLVKEFFEAFVREAAVTMHIKMLAGEELHHKIEAIFKAFAKALEEACQIDERQQGIPSTKGVI